MMSQTVSLGSINTNNSTNSSSSRSVNAKTIVQLEDLEFLSQILQQHLRINIPSGQLFCVKCAAKNDKLMILIQHPNSVIADTQKVFTSLVEALESVPSHQAQKVQLYLRQTGKKLPYAKKDLLIHGVKFQKAVSFQSNVVVECQSKTRNAYPTTEDFEIPVSTKFNSSSSLLNITAVTEEPFEPVTGIPNLREDKSAKPKSKFNQILLFTGLFIATIFSGVGYLLMSPCVLMTCKELQIAKELQGTFPQLVSNVKSETDLVQLEKQITNTVTSLQKMPGLSIHKQEIEKVRTNLVDESQQINRINQSLQIGTTATQTSRSFTTNIEELKTRSQLWRKAIAPLEIIRPDSKLYSFAQSKLSIYRSGLQRVNVQLLAQGKWQQKINDSQAVAKAAMQRESTAKTLPELQQTQATWQIVINALSGIPQTSPAYPEAQKLLAEYKPKLIAIRDRAFKLEQSIKNFTQAVATAKLAEQYQQQNQWQQAVNTWQKALNTIRQVPVESPFYNQALPLVEAYSIAFQEAQAKSQSPTTIVNTDITRADLEKTCMGTVRVCNFTVDSRFINVRITPEYEQTLQSNVTNVSQEEQNNFQDVKKHLETLQTALEIISDNANLAVFVFDAQGQLIFSHLPRRD
jgi:tetratricopeptide (TPR) repeat protein